ncbi:hypothetical protein DSAG12_01482 [Promethearchaeum syntrophicum]|uniref:Uncharacterized protein n=1 Tax=Promethearchaeum syntrophicum TaxID=2594042 RepID=A0A5B9D9M0_9ARCH|nr:hypothetical protein [Candidatus Prometheoarchaeum syntrophicum]
MEKKTYIIPESGENSDFVYNFCMKLFFYLGMICFIPYFIILNILTTPFFPDSSNKILIYGLIIGTLFLLFIMDNIGMHSSFIDRISRLITLILTVVGASLSILILIIPNMVTSSTNVEFYLKLAIILTFEILGWFFIRNSRGLSKVKVKPFYNTSMWSLLLCGIIFLFEYFVKNAIFVFLAIIFLIYPIMIIGWGKLKVIPSIKPRKLVRPYKRTTFYNYAIDIGKAVIILLTILAVIYDGTVVLYPAELSSNPAAWIRNLAIVGIFAALAMEFYIKIQTAFYGLAVIIILYLLCLIQYLLVNTFYFHFWYLIAPINGFTLAGVYFFIEQKLFKSNNVRAMPGSFYVLILIIVISAIILRITPDVDDIIENSKFALSLIGLAYIIGYIREAPKQTSLRISI